MNIEAIHMQGFTTHGTTEVKLPKRGVVLVTGPNGAGKSSLVEAVAYAGWGETLRGTPPFAKEGEVTLFSDMVVALRRKRPAKTTLDWWRSGQQESPATYETTSKAQVALEAVLGPFDRWRRTHVFSSADAAHLTQATDKERKLFLESMKGLGRFDDALTACRDALRRASTVREEAGHWFAQAKVEVAHAEQRAEDAERTLASLGGGKSLDVEAAEAEWAKVGALLGKLERQVGALRQGMVLEAGDSGGVRRELEMLTGHLNKLSSSGKCDACGQEVPAALREKLEASIKAIRDRLERARQQREEANADTLEELAENQELVVKLRVKERALREAVDAWKRTQGVRTQAQEAKAKALGTIDGWQAKVAAAEEKLKKAEYEEDILRACELVLGLKGVRPQLLTRLLTGLEGAANAWLPRLAGGGLRFELKPYSEKKAGGVSDAIGIQVHGAGGGFGYQATSGGERRRLDVALLLALAGQGTLFFDEALDALDEEGLKAAGGVLEELAQERAVVVITHNPRMAGTLRVAQHLHVEGGVVKALPA